MATRQRIVNLELLPPFKDKHCSTLGAYETIDTSSPKGFFGYQYNEVIKTPHHSSVDYGGGHHAGIRIWIHNDLTGVPWLKPLHQGRGAFDVLDW